MQDSRQCVGNSMLWWAKGHNGYTTDIRKAQIFTMAGAKKSSQRASDVLWPTVYIEERVSQHVDMQYCNPEFKKGDMKCLQN